MRPQDFIKLSEYKRLGKDTMLFAGYEVIDLMQFEGTVHFIGTFLITCTALVRLLKIIQQYRAKTK